MRRWGTSSLRMQGVSSASRLAHETEAWNSAMPERRAVLDLLSSEPPVIVVPARAGRAALLELDRVPWERLRSHLEFGTHEFMSSEVTPDFKRKPSRRVRVRMPGFLLDLFSDDAELRADAMKYGLTQAFVHQGTICEASAYAVPFLMAVIADPAVDDSPAPWVGIPIRREMAETLGEILCGALIYRWREDLDAQVVLRARRVFDAFAASDAWRRAAIAAGPADLAEYLAFLGEVAAEEPAYDEDLGHEFDERVRELCERFLTE